VPNLAEKVSKAAPGAVYGVILIAVMFLMPAGAAGFVGSLVARFRRGAKSADIAAASKGGSGGDTIAAPAVLPHGVGPDAGVNRRL
jgi:hypothetical protein